MQRRRRAADDDDRRRRGARPAPARRPGRAGRAAASQGGRAGGDARPPGRCQGGRSRRCRGRLGEHRRPPRPSGPSPRPSRRWPMPTGERDAAASDLEAADAELERARAAGRRPAGLTTRGAGYTRPHGSPRLDRHHQLRPRERPGEGVHRRPGPRRALPPAGEEVRVAHPQPQGGREVRQGGRGRRHRDGLRARQGPLRHVRQGRAERAQARVDEGHRGDRLRRPRRHRPDLLRAHLLAGARRRPGQEGLPAAPGGDGGPRAGRHRHRRDAQQAVPHGDPAARQRAGHVDDALRRRGRAPSRHRRTCPGGRSPTPRR